MGGGIMQLAEVAVRIAQAVVEVPVFAGRPDAGLRDPEQAFIKRLQRGGDEAAEPRDLRDFQVRQRGGDAIAISLWEFLLLLRWLARWVEVKPAALAPISRLGGGLNTTSRAF
jgi:hypothetical protein